MNIILSIIVPTYKRIEKLKNCIHALLSQDYPQEQFEIIVVDDAADYRIEQVVSDFAKKWLKNIIFADCVSDPAVKILRAFDRAVRNNPNSSGQELVTGKYDYLSTGNELAKIG